MPTAALNTYPANPCQSIYAGRNAKAQTVKFGNSATYAKGTVMGQITATGLWIAYTSGAVDGSQVAKGICQYDVVTDGSGNHTIGGGDLGWTEVGAPVLFNGLFRTTELTGLDATSASALGRLISGSVSDGILAVNGG